MPTAVRIKQDPPHGSPGKVTAYKGFTIHQFTDFFMQPSAYAFTAAPEDRWYVLLPDKKTWLYSEEDDPNNILMFGTMQWAKKVIDLYIVGQRKFEEA